MSDPIRDLQSQLRGSRDPISTFYLLESPAGAERMLEKVRLLSGKGVTETDIASITKFVTDVLESESPDRDFQKQFIFRFRSDGTDRSLTGVIQIRNVPGQGCEVELMMPGVIASSIPEFFENGFWTAFMPPSFYD